MFGKGWLVLISLLTQCLCDPKLHSFLHDNYYLWLGKH
jgi:hypothetical protein